VDTSIEAASRLISIVVPAQAGTQWRFCVLARRTTLDPRLRGGDVEEDCIGCRNQIPNRCQIVELNPAWFNV